VALDPLQSFRLDDRVVVVTGASAGLGQRFARVVDAVGARVVLVARRADRLEALAAELRDAIPIAADLTDPDAVDRIVDGALRAFGRLDVVINNAGTVTIGRSATAAEFRRVLDVNLVAPYELAERAAQVMAEAGNGGSIVNVASISGIVGIRGLPQASYAASKAGLVGLTRDLAAEWAKRAIRVNALAPGWFETEMTSEGMFQDERGRAWIERLTPMARGGAEEDLDGAVLFLASDASKFMTGALLTVDGGWTAV
jgi:NAD(P)-dependent dehydrogenase (short-subunit alcohol dehydrogenase family)